MKNSITPAFLKKHPNFIIPKIGMDFSIGVGSDCYAWRIIEVDQNGKGFTAAQYRPVNKVTWPDQDWSFEDENGKPRLSNQTMHCKFSYGHWTMDQHSFYIGTVKQRIYPTFGCRRYYQDPSF